MKFSARASFLLIALLGLTIGAKVAWTRAVPEPDAGLVVARAEAQLREARFETRRVRRPFGVLLFARAADCRMMVADYRPHGTFADALEAYASRVGPLHYVWRGKRSQRPPKLLPLAEYLVNRELRRMGFRPERHPIIAVAASVSCPPDPIDWTPTSSLPR